MRHIMFSALLAAAPFAVAEFNVSDDGQALTVSENSRPVLVYHYSLVTPPDKVPEKFRRACYIHPLYGLDGEVMTQDFPLDHYHHRGVFWAWPDCFLGEKPLNVWLMDDVRQIHEKWLAKEAVAGRFELAVQNAWVYDNAPDTPAMRETVKITVNPAVDGTRALDFNLRMENVSGETITMRGAQTDNKGYGGFCYRPDATRKPMTFTAAPGVLEKDMLRLESPWADVSFPVKAGEQAQSGVAVFQHPSNPGYPFPGWITRAYGFLGASWPHTQTHVMKPGDAFELRYRMLVHRGTAAEAKVAEAFEAYTAAMKNTP